MSTRDTSDESPRKYRSPLREQQAERTRDRIVASAYKLLQSVPAHELSYADIASDIDIAARTIYRHFPDRDELVSKVAHRHLQRILEPDGEWPKTLPDSVEMLRRAFSLMESEPGTYRLFFHLPVRSQGDVQGYVESIWSSVLSQLPDEDRAAAAGLLELLGSPYAFDVLHCNFGLNADAALRACLVAIDILAAALERDPRALSRDRPLPKRFIHQSGE